MLYTDVDIIMLQLTHVHETSLMKVVDVDSESEPGQPTVI